jgi:hypothetical protein
MFEIWHDNRKKLRQPFLEWRLYEPLPSTAAAVGRAVERIIAKREWNLITISRSFEKPINEKPHHD